MRGPFGGQEIVNRTWILLGMFPLAIKAAAAQVPSAHVDSIKGEVKVVFPAMPLSESGCRYSTAESGRVYSWTASAPLPNSSYPNNDIFQLWFHFFLPDTIELTEARFDSIVAVSPIRVAELRGEPPTPREPYGLDKSSVLRSTGQLTMLIQGRAAVDALLQTGARTLRLSWCEGPQKPYGFRAVQLERD
jgi:hypothetical protein